MGRPQHHLLVRGPARRGSRHPPADTLGAADRTCRGCGRQRGFGIQAQICSKSSPSAEQPPAALGEAGGSGRGRPDRGHSERTGSPLSGRAPRSGEPPPASPGVRAELLAGPGQCPRGPSDLAASPGARCSRGSPYRG